MDINELALKKHKEWGGKIEIISRAEIESREDLAVAYTPGVACQPGDQRSKRSGFTTIRDAEISSRSSQTVRQSPGLGDIGPEAAMPVMEGKWFAL